MTSQRSEGLNVNPFEPRAERTREMREVASGIFSFEGYGFATQGCVITDEGVAVIDTGVIPSHGELMRDDIRARTQAPIAYAIYTHGHLDHIGGAKPFVDAGAQIIGHENVPTRLDRYRMLEEQINIVNSIQFHIDIRGMRRQFVYPTVTYRERYDVELGGRRIELFHGKGETDDCTLVWVPDARVIFAGDLFTWVFPNIGNPLKIVRYEKEWFEALERVRDLRPAAMVPGHGPAIVGETEVREALSDWIDVLRFLHEQVVAHLNRGSRLEDMYREIILPERLARSRYLRPVYGCREFAIANIARRYSGWIDYNPANLYPAPRADVAQAILDLAGDPDKVLAKARALKDEGRLQVALQVIDVLTDARPDDSRGHALRAEILDAIASADANLISRDIFIWARDEARKRAGGA